MQRCEDCENIILDPDESNDDKYRLEYAKCRANPKPELPGLQRVTRMFDDDTERYLYCTTMREKDTCDKFDAKLPKIKSKPKPKLMPREAK